MKEHVDETSAYLYGRPVTNEWSHITNRTNAMRARGAEVGERERKCRKLQSVKAIITATAETNKDEHDSKRGRDGERTIWNISYVCKRALR